MSSPTALPISTPPLDEVVAMVQDRLDRLPGRPEQIAEFLEARGYRGVLRSAYRCPFSIYLGENVHATYIVRTDDDEIDICRYNRPGHPLHRIPALAYITTFIRNFDRGAYPELIALESPTA